MKKNKFIPFLFLVGAIAIADIFSGCTKVEKGFISPYQQYAVSQFTIIRGRVSTSYSLINDGSSVPMKIKWTHIYDSTGKIVDDMFAKKYTVGIWTASYNPKTDLTYGTITAKRSTAELTPIEVNEANGTIVSNEATLNLPLGKYIMDLEVSNVAGTIPLKKIMQLNIVDGASISLSPDPGAFSLSLLKAGTAGGAGAAGGSNNGVSFNGNNNPFIQYTVKRFADTPNVVIIKLTDKNGVVFNPKAGEIAKRPNGGLNPNPPFLQNLQDYAPDTFSPNDTAMTLKFPLVPFPINSLGNGFNMYYRIPTQFVSIDSTKAWSSNTAGNFYTGTSDSHYLGVYTNDKYDYAIRIPLRIYVPGSYFINIKILGVKHR
ncbi:MAG: hypothetical protein ABIP35_16585 [Ginsengibacter sp.]